jgi:hypothetical protein
MAERDSLIHKLASLSNTVTPLTLALVIHYHQPFVLGQMIAQDIDLLLP